MPAALLSLLLLGMPQLKPWPTKILPAGLVKSVGGPRLRIPSKTAKATVVFFVTVDCPIGNRYAPEIRSIVRKYSKRVDFLTAYTDPTLTDSAIEKHGKDFGLTCPAFRDERHVWVNRIGAAVTPEAAVLSPTGRLLYRGRIDDIYKAPGSRKEKVERADLRIALDEILAGKQVSQPMMLPVGCAISPLS